MENNLSLDRIMGTEIAIFQDPKTFRFSIDSVLISRFANIKSSQKILDLGSGNGVITLILSDLNKDNEITGIEINPYLVQLANRSIEYNNQKSTEVLCGDIRSIEEVFPHEHYDIVISNPPYFSINEGEISKNKNFAFARHEVNGTLEDFVFATSKMLKYRGKAYFVYTSSRIVDLLYLCRENGLEPKRLKFVHSKDDNNSNIFLIELIKGSAKGIIIEPNLIIYREDSYTDELLNFIKG